jgi:hypothetical protein
MGFFLEVQGCDQCQLYGVNAPMNKSWRLNMGFQQRMMNMMMGRKNPEDVAKMMGEMMPQMMEKMGPEGMAKMMGEMMPQMMGKTGHNGMAEMMPQMMGKMGHEEIERMMLDMMPRMMDTCFSEMEGERRQFMLSHCRGMLDQMEEKYLGPAVK